MDISSIQLKNNAYANLDRKITIQYLKEPKTTVTYVSGLCDFIDDVELELFIKKLKKALGTNCKCDYESAEKEVINGDKKEIVKYKKIVRCGFNGDNRDRIFKMLQERGISREKIKI